MNHPSASTSVLSSSPDPLWLQAMNLISTEITRGALKPGMRLPPERELCQQLNISRVTLRKALGKLVDDGVLAASHGRGWYVAVEGPPTRNDWPHSLESFTETADRMGLIPTSRVLRAQTGPASIDDAELLAMAPGAPLFYLDRVRLLNDVPIAVDISRIPAGLIAGLPDIDFTSASLYRVMVDSGLNMIRAESTIEAREADESVAANLDLVAGKPILLLNQVVVDSTGRRVLSSTIKYSGERYRLRTSFTRSNHDRPRGLT